MTTEQWRPVVGWNGVYEISNTGRVRRSIPGRATQAGRIMSPRLVKGYERVKLSLKSRVEHLFVARLVCEAFHGPRPPLAQVNHKNGVRTDNRVENLEWCTAQENQRHKFDVLMCPASQKLNPDKAREIYAEATGIHAPAQSTTARKYGVHKNTVQKIASGRIWSRFTGAKEYANK